MKKIGLILLIGIIMIIGSAQKSIEKQTVSTIYIPLADHYPGIIAYEKYRSQMKYANYQLEMIPGPELIRARFWEDDIDIAFNVCPMAMDMFAENPNFRWISLIHRDGNALAINEILNNYVNLPEDRLKRKPDEKVANAFVAANNKIGHPTECGIPSLLATHTVVLYKYLKDNGKTLAYRSGDDCDLFLTKVRPPKSPSFIVRNNTKGIPSSFEQSLPWAEVVETEGYGYVAWYSKDVMKWPLGHVECIILAKDKSISDKRKAIEEVIYYIHKAGQDIESARRNGGNEMDDIVKMIRKHIPAHTKDAIIQSLRIDLNIINYKNLNVNENSKNSLKQIMDLAVEAGFLKKTIDIEAFANENFSTEITEE